MLTFTQTYENQLCGINIGEIDLSKCVTTDNGGKVSWNKNGYTTEVNRLCKEYETQQSAQEVVNDAIKATGYSLSDLYGRGDHKCNDPYYKTFMDKYAGTRDMTDSINLHPNATRPSLDGKKMRYTLGNLDFNTGYKEAPYLKGKRVDLNVITDKQGKFDETKRKKHLAGVIDDCVTKYAAASSKNVQQAPSA